MKVAIKIAGFAIAAAALALSGPGANAQMAGANGLGGGSGGGGRHQHQQTAAKTAPQAPKADEKAYTAALQSLPDKHFDPWHGVR